LGDGGTAEIAEQIPWFYSSDELFKNVKWFNERADYKEAYHEVAILVWTWIGNEIEIDFAISDYSPSVTVHP
jgi:hypothetical protein